MATSAGAGFAAAGSARGAAAGSAAGSALAAAGITSGSVGGIVTGSDADSAAAAAANAGGMSVLASLGCWPPRRLQAMSREQREPAVTVAATLSLGRQRLLQERSERALSIGMRRLQRRCCGRARVVAPERQPRLPLTRAIIPRTLRRLRKRSHAGRRGSDASQ